MMDMSPAEIQEMIDPPPIPEEERVRRNYPWIFEDDLSENE